MGCQVVQTMQRKQNIRVKYNLDLTKESVNDEVNFPINNFLEY